MVFTILFKMYIYKFMRSFLSIVQRINRLAWGSLPLGMVLFLTISGCSGDSSKSQQPQEQEKAMRVSKTEYGTMQDGRKVYLYTLANGNDMEVQIMNFGGIITSIKTPDKEGKVEDIALGFDSLDKYLSDHPNFGALIGRYANRIAGGGYAEWDDVRTCQE